jgi:hypothetical protein
LQQNCCSLLILTEENPPGFSSADINNFVCQVSVLSGRASTWYVCNECRRRSSPAERPRSTLAGPLRVRAVTRRRRSGFRRTRQSRPSTPSTGASRGALPEHAPSAVRLDTICTSDSACSRPGLTRRTASSNRVSASPGGAFSSTPRDAGGDPGVDSAARRRVERDDTPSTDRNGRYAPLTLARVPGAVRPRRRPVRASRTTVRGRRTP